jgi:hypothetical protein
MPISLAMLREKPPLWPTFQSPLRSTAVTARLGRVLGIAFVVCFATGLLSHYQYHPWTWLPVPGAPAWGYRVTQGVHVVTGIACIPLLIAKLWSVFHRLFVWPPVTSVLNGLERGSVAVLVGASVLQLITGFLNVLQFYAWPWDFVLVHYLLSYVIIGSLALHVAIHLPAIREGLATPVWRSRPRSKELDTALLDEPVEGLSRRGVLLATGAGVGLVTITTAGQVVPGLERFALLAPRRPSSGPQGLPVNKTAMDAGVVARATAADYRLLVDGPKALHLTVSEIEALETHDRTLPIACVEGWSRSARWRGPTLLSVVLAAGGNADSKVTVVSLQEGGFNASTVSGGQLHDALLATHLNGERLSLDHGYPLRLIAPNRAGVLQTKWLSRIEIR